MPADAPRAASNAELAGVFQAIADYLALDGASTYRILAYEKVASLFREYPVSVADLASRGQLRTLPGVGQAIETKVVEYLAAGDLPILRELRARYPKGLLTIMRLPGVGPKTARRLWEAVGIDGLQALKRACLTGQIRGLPGMGDKTEANLLRAIESWEARSEDTLGPRRLLGLVEPLATRLVEALLAQPEVTAADFTGSLRRRQATVRDIDLVAASTAPNAVMDAFSALPELAGVAERGGTKLTATTHTGLGVDLRIVPPAGYGNLLQHFTGSADHNVALRGHAQRRGFRINEYNVEHLAAGRPITCATEVEVYELVGLSYIPPELRENQGEIEAAEEGTLPDLIELRDLRGDLHVHSDWTDGRASLEEMALAARERGLEYVCFSDHSQSLAMTGGLGPDRLLAQREAISELESSLGGIRLLAGIEVDILADGRLDLPDEVLARLDFVTASIHSGFGQQREQIMKRLSAAARNPHVHSIGHPTGRLMGRRDPYGVDIEALARLAAETGTLLEINASLDRLDLPAPAARRAVELGATIVICSDAHAPTDFDNLKYAVGEARRGWIRAEDVTTTRPWSELPLKTGPPAG